MAARISRYDWSRTPLGEISGWPQSLKTTLSLMLNSRFPTYMAWGPQMTGFYNDAYVPVLGKKEGLGIPFRQTWAEIWDQVGPIAERTLEGESSFFENLPLQMERFGYTELTYFTFSYSPIRDESGAVGGVLCTVIETTSSVVAEQRRKFQLELSDGLRGLAVPGDITAWACRVLGEYLGAKRAGYATIDGDWVQVNLQGWHDGSVPAVLGERFPLSGFGPALINDLRSGVTVRLDDVGADPRSAQHRSIYDYLMVRAMLIVPLVRETQLIAVVAVGSAQPRRWSDEEAKLVEDAAERTRSAVERAIAEQALKRQLQTERDRLRLLFDQAPTFMSVVRGPDHIFELVNAAYQRLIGRRDFIGRPVREVVPEAEEQGFIAMLDGVYASGLPHVATDASLLLQGEPGEPDVQRYVDFVYQPVFEANGKVSGIFVVGSDTTQRKLANVALHDADRRKDEFLAMLAHELRNPLAPISTAAQLLKLNAADEQRVLQASTIISRQVGHMTHLVDDLLDVSRVTRGLIKLEDEVLDFKAVVSHAIEQARPFVAAQRHVLTIRTTATPARVRGDRTRLVQVIVNLLNNAARYTPEAGEIGLAVEVTGEQVTVTVSDTGIGLDPSLVPHIFELFTQGERASDRSHGGLGLGLALVRSLVGLHGGQVAARSGGAGQGSTFTVCLPLAPEPLATAAAQPAPDAPPAARSLRIMVVDDNLDAAETLAALLTVLGHEVTVQPGAGPALDAAALEPPEVFILDIGLPGMDGYELASRLREREAHAHALLIALTGYGQAGDHGKSMAAGFQHHLVKPVDSARLMEILSQQALARHTGP